MEGKNIAEIPKKLDRLDSKIRNRFQKELIQVVLGENPSEAAQLAWTEGHSKDISDIIDNSENTIIRGLIVHGNEPSEKIDNHTKNYEAAILVNVMLDQDESHGQFSKAA